jgi:hypothetical protein
MAGGPIFPMSRTPDATGRVFPNIHTGGSNSRKIEGMGVEASVGADCIWFLLFEAPQVVPSGTPYLRAIGIANAITGAAKVNPKWASIADEENFDTISLNAETVQTLTWSAGDADVFKELKVELDADTIMADEYILIALTFETSSWTLAQVSTWLASIIWE